MGNSKNKHVLFFFIIFVLSCISLIIFFLNSLKQQQDSLLKTLSDPPTDLIFNIYQTRIEAFRNQVNKYKVWQSQEKYEKIDNVLLQDLDNDQENELIVLFWRYGDYLGERNFLKPIAGDNNLSQHINIYKLKPYIHLSWGGSSLPEPIVNLSICSDNKPALPLSIKGGGNLCAEKSTYQSFPKPIYEIRLVWKGWWWEEKRIYK